jgi:type IV pilus assembly protein PilW
MAVSLKSQRGLSLVELMISITLGLILIAGVIHVFLSSREVFATQQAMSRAQENGRLGMELMAEDIRMAGYWGCANRGSDMENDLTAGFWNDYATAGKSNAIRGMAASAIPDLAPAALVNAPALVIRYASGIPLLLTEDNETKAVQVAGSLANGCVGGVCVNKPAIISNCVAARVFSPSAISNAGVNAVRIEHTGYWDSSVLASIHDVFYPGAEVLSVNTVVFYLANNIAGRPSLYRFESATASAVEVIEGVERINFLFGVNGDFLAPADVGSWNEVTAVQVEMLVQGGDQNVLADNHSYFFAGANVQPAEPKRLYQVFSTTVAIRSSAE